MARKKKIGNVHTNVNRKQSRQGGHTTGGVRSGIAQEERRLTMLHQQNLLGNNEKNEKREIQTPSVEMFYSIGMGGYRVQFVNWEQMNIGKQYWLRLVSESFVCGSEDFARKVYEQAKDLQNVKQFRALLFNIESQRQRDNLVKFPS